MPDRIELDWLNDASPEAFAAALAGIVEHAPGIAAAAAAGRPFATVEALHSGLFAAIERLSPDERRALIRNHPELAGREVEAGRMTAESSAEQGGAGLDRLGGDDVGRLSALNAAYRARFGFPFLICVRRHTRRSIFAEAERRLGRGRDEELAEALRQIFYVTRLRVMDLVEGPGPPAAHGRLTTHVLDTAAGRPAAGVLVELRDLSDGDPGLLASARTNAEGRLDAPLVAGRPLPIGTYELAFHVGPHFAATALAAAPTGEPFLSVVPIRFGIAEPEGHYHIPLAVTPWSYTTYRGS